MKRLKPVKAGAEPGADVRQFENEPRNPRGFVFGQVEKHWLSAASAARYLDFPNVRAFYKWVDRHRNLITKSRCGRSLRFDRRELDAAMRPVLAIRRRA